MRAGNQTALPPAAMKTTSHLVILLMLQAVAAGSPTGATSAAEPAAGKRKVVYSESMTDDELRGLQKKKLFGGTAPAPAEAVPRPRSFAETSDFIAFRGFSTFVPKGAILHTPAGLRQHLVQGPAGELVLWGEFLRRYPALVAPLEISLTEASGAKAIDPALLDPALRSGRIIVAVTGGNPTSVARPAAVPPKKLP